MNTPDKNQISSVPSYNFDDSPDFPYLSPMAPTRPIRPENMIPSLQFTPSSLFLLSQLDPYYYHDSSFSSTRYHPLDLSSPVVRFSDAVQNSSYVPEGVSISGLCEEQQKCIPEQLANVSETKSFEERISLANDLVNSRKRVKEMEAETVFGAGKIMLDVAGIQNSEQHIPNVMGPSLNHFSSKLQQFSLCSNNSVKVVESEDSCCLQVAAGAPNSTFGSLSNVAAIDLTAEAEDKENTGSQFNRKQRSSRKRCLNYGVGGSNKRIPLRDSTNDLPAGFISINKAPSPQKCLDTSQQDTKETQPILQTYGLHQNKYIFKESPTFPHDLTTFHHNIEDEFLTPDFTKRDMVSCDIENMEVPERSMEGECTDKGMPTENMQFSQGPDELGGCKLCNCRKSQCLKLYCNCFAARVYCLGPCSCENCFNKPIHEDVVKKARQVLEANNPLAFAPKVVPSSDSATDLWDGNNKTPPLARHTRGCNCKKSRCSKRYCECFANGVGCSSECRCMNCENNYGRKNVEESDAIKINDEANGHHNNASSQSEETPNNERRRHPPIPSSEVCRSLASLYKT